jgi:plasmid stabilization system protein ParE
VAKPVIFDLHAINDAKDAFEWYEERETGLGDEFFRALSTATTYISREPKTVKFIEGHFRRVLLRRFPYGVIFREDDDRIVVFAVFHYSQNPDKLKERLKDR